MERLRKMWKNCAVWFVLVASIPAVLGTVGCSKSDSAAELRVDKGDEKIAAEKIAEGDRLYEDRDDMARARVAVAALRQARTADYGNYEAAWKLARAAYYVADHTDDGTERSNMFREGTEAGKAAVKLQPDKPEGHFWLGANYGGTAEHSTLANLSSFQDIKGEMEAVIKLDEKYHGASAYVGLGRLYLKAPGVMGGDVATATEYLQKGLKLNPSNPMLKYYLAEAFEQANRDADAKKQLEGLFALTPDPLHVPEHKDAMAKAQKLLKKLEAK
jgi:tetratricopeptide (TPR) repeat protein